MRLLAINQFFPPGVAATGELLADVLIEHAGDSTVICGRASYRREADPAARPAMPDVSVRRVGSRSYSQRKLGKIASYAAFFAGALRETFRVQKPDIVLTMTTPPLLSVIGYCVQRLRGSRHFIWEMDVYPDIATDLGVIAQDGMVARVIATIADFTRRRADGVIALGPCMAQRLRDHGVPGERIHVCHNWADGARLQPRPFVRDGRLKVLYSGNFGLAHDFETLAAAIRELSIDDGIHFSFNGGGPRKESIRQVCNGAASHFCHFDSLRSLEQFDDALASCDVGLVLQKAETCGSVVPSKTYGIMAAGRPIVFVGPRKATPALLIHQHGAGWQIDNGDSAELTRLLKWLLQNPSEIEAAGARARTAFERHYSSSIGIGRVLAALGASSTINASQETQRRFQPGTSARTA